MKWKKIFAAAAKSIWKNGTRSLLTALGIIIGVGAVIVMVAIGTGSQRDIEQRIQSLGTNLLMVRPGANRFGGVNRGAGSAQSLTLDDAEALRQYADHLEAVSPAETANGQVIAGAQNWSTSIEGVAPSYPSIRRWDVARRLHQGTELAGRYDGLTPIEQVFTADQIAEFDRRIGRPTPSLRLTRRCPRRGAPQTGRERWCGRCQFASAGERRGGSAKVRYGWSIV